MLNRDSLTLKVLCLLSVVLGVLSAVTDPVSLGFSPETGAIVVSWVKLLSTLVAAITGWLMTSPLKGENDDKRVGNGPRAWLLPLLLAGSVLTISCAGQTPAPVTSQPTAEQVQVTRAQALKIAQAVESVGNLVVEARRVTTAAYNAQLITRDQAIAAYRSIEDLAPQMSAMIGIASTVTTDPQLRSTVTAMMAVVDTVVERLVKGSPSMAGVGGAIQAALRVAAIYLGGAR
jgi:hypothetical protein